MSLAAERARMRRAALGRSLRGAGRPRWRPDDVTTAGGVTDDGGALAGRAGLRDGRQGSPVPGVGRVRVRAISSTSPRGYHAPAGGQAWHDSIPDGGRSPSGRRVIGLRQVDEMTLRPGRLVAASPGPTACQPPAPGRRPTKQQEPPRAPGARRLARVGRPADPRRRRMATRGDVACGLASPR